VAVEKQKCLLGLKTAREKKCSEDPKAAGEKKCSESKVDARKQNVQRVQGNKNARHDSYQRTKMLGENGSYPRDTIMRNKMNN